MYPKRTNKCYGVSKKRKIKFEINQKDIEGVVIGTVLEGLMKFQ